MFDASPWGTKYPPIAMFWRRAWEQVIPFFAFAPDIRKIVYTTNAIESLHMQLRKIIKARGHFPSDEAALKLIWLALRNVIAKWTGSRHDWKSSMTQFALLYPERFSIGILVLTRLTHEIPDTSEKRGRALTPSGESGKCILPLLYPWIFYRLSIWPTPRKLTKSVPSSP